MMWRKPENVGIKNRTFSYDRFITKAKSRTVETIGFIFFLVLAADFSLKEIVPILHSIWNTLHVP